MFASIAARYDLLNHLLSGGLDLHWRRVTARALDRSVPQTARVLDLCTGTGDLALELCRRRLTVASDFCWPMLVRGRRKAAARRQPPFFVGGDALQLPFAPASFDAVTIAFGLRNLEDRALGLREIHRVLKPGGLLLILEFSLPTLPLLGSLYRFYFTRVLPRIGRWVSGEDGPYAYLPRSVAQFPAAPELRRLMEKEGLIEGTVQPLSWGVVTLYRARRGPEADTPADG